MNKPRINSIITAWVLVVWGLVNLVFSLNCYGIVRMGATYFCGHPMNLFPLIITNPLIIPVLLFTGLALLLHKKLVYLVIALLEVPLLLWAGLMNFFLLETLVREGFSSCSRDPFCKLGLALFPSLLLITLLSLGIMLFSYWRLLRQEKKAPLIRNKEQKLGVKL